MIYPETRTQQVLRLILAIHCARLYPLLPDNPLDLTDWFASLSPDVRADSDRLTTMGFDSSLSPDHAARPASWLRKDRPRTGHDHMSARLRTRGPQRHGVPALRLSTS